MAALSNMQGDPSSQEYMKAVLNKFIEMDNQMMQMKQNVDNLNAHVVRLTNENKQLRGWLHQAPRI